jgi:N6-adenosine-specific RNA methylase IME4
MAIELYTCLAHQHCMCVCVCVCVYAETLEETEEASITVNVRNKTEIIIIPYYVVHNISSNKIYLWRLANTAKYSVPCMREWNI